MAYQASTSRVFRRSAVIAIGVVAAAVVAACGSSGGTSAPPSKTSTGGGPSTAPVATGLMQPGVLTVGMNLQFKPEMYLDSSGKPAGYDVDLLNKLAASLGVKLDIQNLDFNGLIPGLQSKKFDLVSVGLTPNPDREKVVDFTRAYVPYASVLAVKASYSGPATIAAFNTNHTTITALQGSSDEDVAKKSFPKANVQGLADQNATLLEVQTGRATAAVLENYILAQYMKANPNSVKQANLPKPLFISYGSWAVQKGNRALLQKLNAFLCQAQSDGTLAALYKQDFGATMPAMPGGC